MRKVTVTVHGMEGSGGTVKEARQDAGTRLKRAMEANYEPKVLSYRGNTWIVWRTPRGLVSASLDDGKIGGTCFCENDMERVVKSVRLHLAQLGWTDDDDSPPTILRGDEGLIGQFASWVGFQLAYREGKRRDLDDNQAHRFGCDNADEFAPKFLDNNPQRKEFCGS